MRPRHESRDSNPCRIKPSTFLVNKSVLYSKFLYYITDSQYYIIFNYFGKMDLAMLRQRHLLGAGVIIIMQTTSDKRRFYFLK